MLGVDGECMSEVDEQGRKGKGECVSIKLSVAWTWDVPVSVRR